MKRNEFLATIALGLPTLTSKPEQCSIKTARVCSGCEYRLAKSIAYEKGVKDVNIDLDKKVILITYHPQKTSPEVLKRYIISIGYDADELKADVQKREEVHGCCLKEGGKH